jgi:hypothetical protein
MSGYIPRERAPAPTREQAIALTVSIIAAILMMFIALYASKVALGWVGTIGKIPIVAPVMFIVGSTMLILSGPGSRDGNGLRSVRFRRYYAFFVYALGAAMFALPFVVGGR